MKHGHFQVLFMQIYGHRLDPTAETQDNERIREMLPLEATHVSENQRHKTRIPGCLKIPGVASSAAAFWAFCAWRMAAMMKMVASLDPWTCWSHRCHSDYHWIPEKPAEAIVIITRVYRQTWATRRLEMHQAGIAGISQPLRVETASVGKVWILKHMGNPCNVLHLIWRNEIPVYQYIPVILSILAHDTYR